MGNEDVLLYVNVLPRRIYLKKCFPYNAEKVACFSERFNRQSNGPEIEIRDHRVLSSGMICCHIYNIESPDFEHGRVYFKQFGAERVTSSAKQTIKL